MDDDRLFFAFFAVRGEFKMVRLLCYMPTPGGLTGAPRRLLTLCRVLQDEGLDACIMSEPGSELLSAAEEQNVTIFSINLKGILGLRHGALFGGSMAFMSRVVVALFKQNLLFRRRVIDTHADVVWLRGAKGIVLSATGAWLARRPIVWDIDYELPSRGGMRCIHFFGLWISCRVVYQYSGAAERIFGRETAEKSKHKSYSLIPGVNLDRLEFYVRMRREQQEKQCEEQPYRILQVGTICERKNQQLMIKSLSAIKRMRVTRNVQIQIAGGIYEKSYARSIEKLVADAGLQESVEFLGWRDDIHDLMCKAQLLVMPSLDEGVPNAVQEAMYIGLPVIVSSTGGMPQIVEHGRTGWILPPDDSAEWARQILYCMSNPRECEAVGLAATRYAGEYFGKARWGRLYAGIIRAVIDQKKAK